MFQCVKNIFFIDQFRNVSTRAQIDAQIRALERTFVIDGGGPISKIDVCSLPANSPSEDNFSIGQCLSSDAVLCGVFDGHGGYACSRYVSIRLFDYLCAAVLQKHIVKENIPLMERLKWLITSTSLRVPQEREERHKKNIESFYNSFIKSHTDQYTVRKAIQAAFIALDKDIEKAALPDNRGIFSKESASIAATGSCATVAHIRQSNLHVASIGDSVAVLGIRSNDGVSSRQLSRLHNPDNADEVKRIRQEHPQNERGTIFKNGRLLGDLIPLRAFGDVQFKLTKDLQKIILSPLGYKIPTGLLTPPYLSALPDVFYHQLTPNDKFLIICSDGVFDFLDADTTVRIVHDHRCGIETLTPYSPSANSTLGDVICDLQERRTGTHKNPIDKNSATHIIRHALGGVTKSLDEQYANLKTQLTHPQGVARSYRDDMTVIVVHFNESYLDPDD
ncbi:GM14286p [Strongyloides ratti]|uniref:GM14286p n=1 Tax=Strongyloides ratti TaxID=34506 RepID=A0A090LKN5_STRRB|nr:GM14286p [Strongyloides ratti]CEF68698.1 GM14286p [Strongyloides ratti]